MLHRVHMVTFGEFLDRPSLRAKQYETFVRSAQHLTKQDVTCRLQADSARLILTRFDWSSLPAKQYLT